jgi:precorrin-2/cobalt-factor-2 C20-methyltransferase
MVSLGPGDAELITLKALRALQEAETICVPTKSADRSFERSLTHRIVAKLMEEHGFSKTMIPVYTPMKLRAEDWEHQVDTLIDAVERHGQVAFVTLGDAAVYSTVYYLLDLIKERDTDLYAQCDVIPGITSFSLASAMARKPLCVGESRLEIVPLLDKALPTTTVYMRPKIGMTTEAIGERGEMFTFEDLTFATETITPRKIPVVKRYMTLLIDFFR